MSSFKELDLHNAIITALDKKGYHTPTPIQSQAIPHILQKKDILGIAQTGTGKTAAFSLPILHNLHHSNISVKSGNVRALILTPTRELACQIAENVEAYSTNLNLRHAVIYGGVSEKQQINAIQLGVDILIATPGRLMDLMSQGYIRLMQLEIFVLDEADRMLDMGFIADIKKITARIPANRQTLFFSATMPKAITQLANEILQNPTRIEITPESTTVDRIDQRINFVSNYNKPKLLKHILKQKEARMVLVFCRTKHGADNVEEMLERSRIPVAAIHGNRDQDARQRALDNFRDGNIRVLVATDIAARGIDIATISHVINYDLPNDPESYVHRIGRTARAGRKGVAISFCDPKDDQTLLDIEKAINFKIPVDDSHPFSGKNNKPQAQRKPSPHNRDKKPQRKNAPQHKKQEHSKKGKSSKEKKGIIAFLKALFTGKSKPKRNNKPNHSRNRAQPHKKRPQHKSGNRRPQAQKPRPKQRQNPRNVTARKISSGNPGSKPTQ